jgi:Fe-S cluster biogenesis protein NfuA
LEWEEGSLELVAVEERIARVRVRLAVAPRPSHPMGLLAGIQRTVQSTVSEIRAVVNEDLVTAGYSPEQLAIQMERFQA